MENSMQQPNTKKHASDLDHRQSHYILFHHQDITKCHLITLVKINKCPCVAVIFDPLSHQDALKLLSPPHDIV